MKKLFTYALSIALPFAASAQFSEDFEGASSAISPLPAGWTIYNVDGLTPSTSLPYLATFDTSAWVRIKFTSQDGNTVAVSTSYYNPAGQSDDWMVTPAITVPALSPYLLFDAMAPDQSFADDYEVYISTTGNQVADFTTMIHSESSPPGSLQKVAVDLSAYAGQQVYIAFRNVANDELMLWLDNVEVLSLDSNDVAVTDVNLVDYATLSSNNNLTVTIKNVGFNVVNTADVIWTDGTNQYTFNATNLNLQPYTSTTVTHSTQVSYANVVEKTIAIGIPTVNGGVDLNPGDNTSSQTFHTVSSVPVKKVVFEEGTGTWCGYCPRGTEAMKHMYSNYPNFIGIAVHNQDPMTVTAYDNGANFSAYPNSNIDREILGASVSQSIWVSQFNQRKDMVTPAGVGVVSSFDSVSNQVTAVAYANFVTDFATADFRLAVVVYENNVDGTGSGWNQVNYYSDAFANDQGSLAGWDNLPYSADVSYDHVGRALLGGYNGQPSSVPAVITNGDSVSYSFNYTLSGNDPDALYVVAFLIDESSGYIINAGDDKVTATPPSAVQELSTIQDLKLYPNPSREFVNVTFGLEKTTDVLMSIYTVGGKLVRTENYQHLTGKQNMVINVSNLAAGQYIISFATDKGAVVKQLIVQ